MACVVSLCGILVAGVLRRRVANHLRAHRWGSTGRNMPRENTVTFYSCFQWKAKAALFVRRIFYGLVLASVLYTSCWGAVGACCKCGTCLRPQIRFSRFTERPPGHTYTFSFGIFCVMPVSVLMVGSPRQTPRQLQKVKAKSRTSDTVGLFNQVNKAI